MKLREVKEIEYDGWIPMTVYVMELSHGLMGFFPLIEKETKKIIVCKNRDDLRKIWEALPKRKVKVSEFEWIVNEKEDLVVPIGHPQGDEADSDWFFFISKDLEKYLADALIEENFKYAPGLLSLTSQSGCTFPEK